MIDRDVAFIRERDHVSRLETGLSSYVVFFGAARALAAVRVPSRGYRAQLIAHFSRARYRMPRCWAPSIETHSPVTHWARGEARNTATSATSSAVPRRPAGMLPLTLS